MAGEINSGMDQGNVETDTEWQQRQLISLLEQKRKEEEAVGIVLNGIRYAGSQGNRQALQEALKAAEEYAMTAFDSWKDSDGGYHANHPVADVREAYRQIGLRRMALIAKESEYAAQIKSGQVVDLGALAWSV